MLESYTIIICSSSFGALNHTYLELSVAIATLVTSAPSWISTITKSVTFNSTTRKL